MTTPLDILECSGFDGFLDLIEARDRRCAERDCVALRCTVCRLLEHQPEPVCGELAELISIAPLDCLQRIVLALAQGKRAGDLCQDLGIPLSRRRDTPERSASLKHRSPS